MRRARRDGTTESSYLRLSEALELMGVSPGTMTRLVAAGVLPTIVDPLDRRSKLVKRADVEALLAQTRHSRMQQASA